MSTSSALGAKAKLPACASQVSSTTAAYSSSHPYLSYINDNDETPRRKQPTRLCASMSKSQIYIFDHAQEVSHAFGTRSSASKTVNVSSAVTSSWSIRHSTLQRYTMEAESSQPTMRVLTKDEVAHKSALEQCPFEIQHMIVGHFDDDKDLVNFRAISKTTYAAVGHSAFRVHFLKTFDDTPSHDIESYKKRLEMRQCIARTYITFDRSNLPTCQPHALAMLQEVIEHAVGVKEDDGYGYLTVTGMNFEFLARYLVLPEDRHRDMSDIRGSDLLEVLCKSSFMKGRDSTAPKARIKKAQTIQLCLLHLIFQPRRANMRRADFFEAQNQAYKCFRKATLLRGPNNGQINLEWVLHIVNFFKYHLRHQLGHTHDALFAHSYLEPGAYPVPRAWPGRLRDQAQPVGKCWMGSFTYLLTEDLMESRGTPSHRMRDIQDHIYETNNGFQEFELFFDIDDESELQWPRIAELMMPNSKATAPVPISPGSSNIAIPSHKDFFGLLASDGEHQQYHFYGRIHALPPQPDKTGISGFQQISMVKLMPDENGQYTPDGTNHWLYEGIVIPGGQIMLGRWWNGDSDDAGDGQSYCGPFLFWCVEEAGEAQVPEPSGEKNKKALDFIRSIKRNLGF